MVQTPEEKAARRKARREKRKELKSHTVPSTHPTPPTPQAGTQTLLEDETSEKPIQAQRPYSGFQGTLFEKYTDFEENPNCFRIYSEVFNLLGLIKLTKEDKKWIVAGTRYPENWDFSGKHDTIDAAMKVLYDHYYPLVVRDMGLKGEFKPWFDQDIKVGVVS